MSGFRRRFLLRLLICLLLGVATTTTLAWTRALRPGQRQWFLLAFPLEPTESPLRILTIEQELAPGHHWIQASTNGLADNVPVPAWSSSTGFPKLQDQPWRLTEEDMQAARASLRQFRKPTPSAGGWTSEVGPPQDWPAWLPTVPRGDGLFSYGGRAAGWPFPTMRSISKLDSLNGQLQWRGSLRLRPLSSYPPSLTRDPQAGCVPLLPIPLPFAASMLLFASPWLVIFFGTPALRRHLRRRRGHCLRCGYDIQRDYTRPCPECGTLGA